MRVFLSFVCSLLVVGCATTPESHSPPAPLKARLANTEAKEGDQTVRHAFTLADGKRLQSIIVPDLRKRKVYGVEPGERALTVDFYRRGSFWNDGTGIVARGEVRARLKEGRTYEIKGRYVFGEMRGVYKICDLETGEPASEEFDVTYVVGNVPPLIVPIFVPK